MKARLLTIFILCALFLGCEKETSKKKQIPVLDIKDAESLVLLESSKKSNNAEVDFYKVTIDGSLKEIKFINPDGSELQEDSTNIFINVNSIYDINNDYFLLTGSFSVWDSTEVNQKYNSLLVRKTDGAIFNFGEVNVSKLNTRLGENIFQHDNNGNIYYSDNVGMIHKVDISNPKSIGKSEYLSAGQYAKYYGIGKNGNCIYRTSKSAGVTNSNGTLDLRIRKDNGAVHDIIVPDRDNKEFWIGNDGNIYFISYTWNDGYQPVIHKINLENNQFEINTVWTPQNTEEAAIVGSLFIYNSLGTYIIRKDQSIVFVDTYNKGANSWEFSELNYSVVGITLPPIEQNAKIVYSSSYYYIATGTDLYKISLATHEYSILLPSGEYEIYTLTVSNDDHLQISALRLSDGKKIFAEIESDGTLKIINEENKKGIVLQRLNK